ncbi:MAG TPA: 3-hydroxybutyrate oligomer hydrolase family protein [Casimicrobiaceae bacterium]|nr:3-hydroxybutyrate oligomer hydrolase family protein [Casimicrobiaceae bacterium]
MFRRTVCIAALTFLLPLSAAAGTRCDALLAAFGHRLVDATCYEKGDLTTNGDSTDVNPTTPLDNSIAGLPVGAYRPRTDRAVLVNPPNDVTAITTAVPGVQISGWFASDPAHEARFLLRLPNHWNGKLVVAGTPSQRSEFSSDYAWSDYVVQKGYAYASQNKGMYGFYQTHPLTPADPVTDPLGCRYSPTLLSTFWLHFYDDDPGKPFTQWAQYMIDAAKLARIGAEALYGDGPNFTYAVGTSNGGYQVRRAVELAPQLFDGGVDWEGTYVDSEAPNILTDLPPAVLNYPDYAASGFSASSTAAKNIQLAGYPPDIVGATTTLWRLHYENYWELTMCQWQKRLDPTYNTYGTDGTGLWTYNYIARLSVSDVGAQLDAFATTGLIQSPLITVAGTMDSLLPIDHHARAYARAVADSLASQPGYPHRPQPAYRLYEVQNGNHIESYKNTFPNSLEYILPHAQKSFDLLVANVEHRATLPASQCIARGGAIGAASSTPGHCASLFVGP